MAARYLTIVPLPARSGPNGCALGRAAGWFPVVGLVLGLALVAVERVTGRLFPPLLSVLLTLTAWKLLTGGLHLDGLADCLDGLAGRDPGHRLAIMRDGSIGAFGAIGLILLLLLEIGALTELPEHRRWQAVLAAPVVARAMPIVVGRLFVPATGDGHGATFQRGVRPSAIPVAFALALLAAFAALGPAGLLALGMATLLALGLGRFFTRRLGGVTGDVLGASVELAELVVLLTVSAWVHARP